MSLHAERPAEPDPSYHGIDPNERDEARQADPFPSIHHLRRVAPVNETPMGVWRLSRYEDCVRLLRGARCGVRHLDGRYPRRADDQGPGDFMLLQDPPNHTRLRNLVSRSFTPRAAESWRTRAQAIANECLDRALERGAIDVIADLALPVPSTLICEMLGVPVADRDRFTQWTADATHGLAGTMAPPETQARAQAAALALAGYFDALIAERRNDKRDDLLSQLIRAEEQGDRLTPGELVVQSIGLLIAGFETTIGLIGNGAAALARHPAEQAKLRARPDLVPNAVEECLRFDGPIGMTLRVLHEDFVVGGRTIPCDTEVWAMLWGANRDPAVFADPDRFDVERPNAREHLAFGGGAHLCLGAHLARMEGQVALGALVARTKEFALERDRIEWGASLFRVPARLPIAFSPA
ncbi:MAG: cytochrome P450 [Proteobacteria bacterium]|nr:MAG: cytochrome P450 [Pseudomonadota bacterium]